MGLGPVFAFEWLIASRRWQGYAVRSLFVLLLLTALVVIYASSHEVRTAASIRGLSHLGELFYIAVTGTQLTLVLLAAPAATAGAICLDRARGSLAHLLVTDLTDGEIVLGKLAARLVPVLALVGCALPVMAILTLLGGVDPDALVKAWVVTLGVAVLGSALALCFSLWVVKTHEALMGTYAVWGLWLLSAPMAGALNRTMGWSLIVPMRTVDPFALTFAPYWWPGLVDWGDYLWFLAVTLALSALLAFVAVLRLRPVGTRERVRMARLWTRPLAPLGPRAARVARSLTRSFPTFWWMGSLVMPDPKLDFNPVLWREWHRSRPSPWARIVMALFVSLALLFSIMSIFSSGNTGLAAWVNGLQVSVGLLLLSVTAATSLAEERVRGSLDILMATPLSTSQIVLGKWLGTFRAVPALTILPVVVILGSGGFGPDQWMGAILTVAFVCCTGAAITGLGLALATWFSRLGRAVGLSVTLYVLVTVGWIFLVLMLDPNRGEAEGLMMASPFYWAGLLTWDLCDRSAPRGFFAWAIVWILAYALAAVALLVATLATFNRCLGRVGTGRKSR